MAVHPHLQLMLAEARAEQLRREAARATGAVTGSGRGRFGTAVTEVPIVIRPDRPEDAGALVRLAHLDSARVPAAPLLVAEVAGELRAALSLTDGRVIADPFHRTASLVALLTMRAGQLKTEPPAERRRLARLTQRLRRRAARAAA
jgi:hypothetical protein